MRAAVYLAPSSMATSGSRLEGHPELAEPAWPMWKTRPLSFLACLDLADLAPIDTGLDLPIDGTLSFFYEANEQQAWGFDPNDREGWRVIHTLAGAGHQIEPPRGALTFKEVPFKVEAARSIPDFQEEVLLALGDSNDEGLQLALEELEAQGRSGISVHQVGGWPTLQQGTLWLEAQLASSGINVGSPKAMRTRGQGRCKTERKNGDCSFSLTVTGRQDGCGATLARSTS